MSIGEIMVLTLIISAFVTFAATLAWVAHFDRPARRSANQPSRGLTGSMLHLSHR